MFWNYIPLRFIDLTQIGYCPFCPLVVKTKLWYFDPKTKIYVVTDLHPRGFKYRLLAVGSGKYWHRSRLDYSQAEVDMLTSALMKVVREHEEKGIGRLVDIDYNHLSIPQHYHIQANMG